MSYDRLPNITENIKQKICHKDILYKIKPQKYKRSGKKECLIMDDKDMSWQFRIYLGIKILKGYL